MIFKNTAVPIVVAMTLLQGCGHIKESKPEFAPIIPQEIRQAQFNAGGSLMTSFLNQREASKKTQESSSFQRCLSVFKDYPLKHVDEAKGIIETQWKQDKDQRSRGVFQLMATPESLELKVRLEVLCQEWCQGQWRPTKDKALESRLWSQLLHAMAP